METIEIKDPNTGKTKFIEVYFNGISKQYRVRENGGYKTFNTLEEATAYNPNTTDPSENIANDILFLTASGGLFGVAKGLTSTVKSGSNLVKNIAQQGIKQISKQTGRKAASLAPKMLTSTLGGITVDNIVKNQTGQSWGQYMSNSYLANRWNIHSPIFWDYTNPGYSWGIVEGGPFVENMVKQLTKLRKVGNGASSTVYKQLIDPNHVYKLSTIPLDEMSQYTQFPWFAKTQYLGQTPGKLFKYRQVEVNPTSTTSRIKGRIEKESPNLKQYKDKAMSSDELAYIDETGNVYTDINLGIDKKGNPVVYDMSVLPEGDFLSMFYKRGGRLWKKDSY